MRDARLPEACEASVYHLSHHVRMVGLEPTTSPLSVECSNHLSYIRLYRIVAPFIFRDKVFLMSPGISFIMYKRAAG